MRHPPPFPRDASGPAAIVTIIVLSLGAAVLAAPPLDPQTHHLLPGDDGSFPAAGDQTSPSLAPGGGGFLAVWTDDRSMLLEGGGTGQDVYAARLAADGTLVDTTPIVVCRKTGDQYDPRAVWNGTDWLVIWTGTEPSTPFNSHNTEGVRVSGDGAVLDADPFEIWPYGGGDEHVVGAASDGQDWAVVMTDVYLDGLGTKTRLVAIRIAADGTLLYTNNVYSPSCCSFFYRTGMAYADGTYMVVFEGYFDSWNYGIFGLRLSSNLSTLDSYPLELVKVLMQSETHFYRNPTVTSDGANFYLSWQLYLRDTSSQIFGAVVTPAGTSLDGDGVPISSTLPLSLELQPRAAWDGGQWIVGWAEGGQTQLARVDASGAVLDPGGVATGLPADLAMTGRSSGLRIAWDEATHPGPRPFDVLTAAVASDLTIGAEADLARGAPAQLEPDLARGDAGALLAYTSLTSGSARILAQLLDAVGEAAAPGPVELASGAVSGPAVAWNGTRYLVVWEEAGSTRGVRVDADGSVADPVPADLLDGTEPDAVGRDGEFLVVASGPSSVRGVRIADDGTVVDGVPLVLGTGTTSRPVAAATDVFWLATWEQDDVADGGDIMMSAVASDGTIVGPQHITATGDGIAARRPAIAAGDSVLIAWQDDRGGDLDLYGRRLNQGLVFTDPAAGTTLISAAGDQFAAALAWDGERFVLDFADTRDRVDTTDERLMVYRGWAPGVGPVVEPAGLALFTGETSAGDPAVTGAGGYDVHAASVFQPAAPHVAYRIAVSYAGRPTAVGDVPALARRMLPYPNPANPAVTIRFTLRRPGAALIDIYDLRGSRVRTLRAPGLEAGTHEVVWRGRDGSGKPVPSGTYLLRLRSGGVSETGRVTIVQ